MYLINAVIHGLFLNTSSIFHVFSSFDVLLAIEFLDGLVALIESMVKVAVLKHVPFGFAFVEVIKSPDQQSRSRECAANDE